MENWLSEELYKIDISSCDYSNNNNRCEDCTFDQTIGHIEDMIINDKFTEMISTFMEKYCSEFDEGEENKFVYTDIFNEYTRTVESFIEHFLKERLGDFSMQTFLSQLEKRKLEMQGEVFEILLSMSDFMLFKNLMLDYKTMKDGLVADFSSDLSIKGLCK